MSCSVIVCIAPGHALAYLPARSVWTQAPIAAALLPKLEVHLLEERPTAAIELREGAAVEVLEQLGDRLVELLEREEGPVSQAREDPALSDLHADLDLRLVTRSGGTGGITAVP